MKKIINVIMFIMGCNNSITKEAVENGLIDLSGEGRNVYGK